MSDTTTTGNINAKVSLTATEFFAEAKRVQAKAAELGATSPEIKVDANVAQALAQLEALQMAERKLKIAELDLDRVQKDRGATQQQLLRAQNALSSATIGYESLNRRVTAEREKDTQATARQESVVRRFTDALDQNTESGRRGRVGLQALVFLSPAIVGAIAPIGAAAISLAGAFGGMAAAGVLAVIGIKKEMDAGTTTGNAYASGLSSLKTVLDSLSKTAAVSMLGSFQQATATITANLPALNSQIGTFTGLLGKIGTTALDGLITGLRVANPLFQAAGLVVLDLVEKFNQFTASTGFSQFVTYAVGQLPLVMNFLGQTGTLVMNLVQAFAPLGQVTISVLSGLIGMLNSVPLPVLAGLVTTVTSLGVAFKIAPAIVAFGQAIGFVAASSQLAVPVLGIMLAAITGLIAATLSATIGNQANTASVQDYTQALKEDNNAIGEHVRAQAAKAVVDSGAAQAAQRLGLSLQDVTDAAVGNADAIKRIKDATDTASQGIPKWISDLAPASQKNREVASDVDLLRQKILGASGAIPDQIEKQRILAQILGETGNSASKQDSALQQLANKYGVSVTAIQGAQDQQKKTQDQLDATTLAMRMQNDAAGLLKMAWDQLNGKALSAAQAQNAFDSSLANMGTHVTDAGKQITFTTNSINDMSAASVSLRGQLNTQVQNLAAVVAANGGLSNSTQEAKQQYAAMRQQIIDNAVAHGVNRDAVTAYIDKIMQIPMTVTTQVNLDDYASNPIQAIKDRLASIPRDVTTQVRTINSFTPDDGPIGRASGGPVPGYETGGPVSYLAAGGSPWSSQGTDTVRAMLTPGEFVVKQPSVASVGMAALNYINQTGQLPNAGTSPITVNVTVQNPFTGEQVMGVVTDVAIKQVEAGFRDANSHAGRRPSR